MRIGVFLIGLGLTFCTNALWAQNVPLKSFQNAKNDAFTGWIHLLSDDFRFGWRAANQANWNVNENQEVTVSKGDVGLLRTTTQFDQFELSLEFKTAPDTNSGVFIRTSPHPKSPVKDCYEINIAPKSNPFPTGSIVGRAKATDLTDFDYDKWHLMEITCDLDSIQVKIDGQLTTSYRDPKPLGKGYIGLQHNSGPVSFRKIRLRPKGLVSIFNGKDLTGWKTYPEMKSTFRVNQGVLNVQDGPGQLESRGRYGDFVLQLKIKTNANGLNSGVFFRCIPGEKMNGYESQIHNGTKNGDRSQPEDCGTGGIFRRKNARFIVGNDNEWMTKTIVVNGPHIATWVNGVMVCEWTDKRKADANPRRGLRLKPGTLMLQGHDPTTDIDFKDIRIRKIQPRRAIK